METPVVVAIIGLVGGVIVALIQQSRKENKIDHNVVAGLIKQFHKDVVNVEHKLDDHIKEHSNLKPKVLTKKK